MRAPSSSSGIRIASGTGSSGMVEVVHIMLFGQIFVSLSQGRAP